MSLPIALALIVGAALLSAILTALAWRYAVHRNLTDAPGRRRSHEFTTPRGGGIGPVLATLAGGLLLAVEHSAPALDGCLLGLTAVAAIGWVDDHRALTAGLRLGVHLLAALVAAFALLGLPATPLQVLLLAIAVFWIISLTNVWNFMDGIDGLATSQALLVGACLLSGSALYGWLDPVWTGLASILLGALLGFLPFNFPRARIFLGDVGSGALGFAIACLLLRAVAIGRIPWPLALLPVSVFLVDAGLTLAKRVAQGKAWWRPHREHLYQWLVRSGASHARVTCAYASLTLAAALAALGCAALTVRQSAAIVAAALLSSGVLWSWVRMRLMSKVRNPMRRGAAP